ncbi:protein-arginine deiminase family protein [Aestuariibius sp. 2305UL40-4]|uniref:protein-arginine deiminase family protein n=1 Tax=Aestuariibius violaceus TaxID=3234132 RepID=UPI00345EE4A4
MSAADTNPAGEALPSGICMPCSIVNIHVDADRDGTVDDQPGGAAWTPGQTGRGAIICVNCDNDDGKGNANAIDNVDTADATINGGTDLREIAPLDLRKRSELPLENARVVLSVETAPLEFRNFIRIFDGRAAGSSEIIGPGTAAEKVFTQADFGEAGRIELGMEALRFPSRPVGGAGVNFDGYIRLNLRVEATDGTAIHRETVPVRVAPWIVFNHTDVTEKVYVAEITTGHPDYDNDKVFIPALEAIVGGKLQKIPYSETQADRWVQDIMEPGYSSLPGDHDLVSVVRTPNLRDQARANADWDYFGKYPGRGLLGPDYGYYETNVPEENSSLDSFGNLECSPPIPGHPFGRIVYGEPATKAGLDPSSAHQPMKQEMRSLLEGQNLQSPIRLDTGWLVVGHVDEFMSFIPDPSGTHGFKVAFASPALAEQLVRAAHAANRRSKLFQGIKNNDGRVMPVSGLRGLYSNYDKARKILADQDFLDTQTRVQQILDSQKAILKRDLGLADSDFVDLPILFQEPDPAGAPGFHIALTAGSVNMLVVTNSPSNVDLVIPKPFGPEVGGVCQFEQAIRTAFGSNSIVTPHFVDCFMTYHLLAGEIHCGTNTKRIPPARKWWV